MNEVAKDLKLSTITLQGHECQIGTCQSLGWLSLSVLSPVEDVLALHEKLIPINMHLLNQRMFVTIKEGCLMVFKGTSKEGDDLTELISIATCLIYLLQGKGLSNAN